MNLQRDISRVTNQDELRLRTGQRPKDRRSTRKHQRWSYSVSSQQFQALFNSLFKVLCIFPSRYLFAIGLSPVFSFRWNLPPTLSCTPKQLDSSKAHRTHADSQKDGILTLYDALFQGTYSGATAGDSFCRLQFGATKRHSDLKHELLPLHSPLLGESLLVSFPPLSNMLKSSGSSFPSEARKGRPQCASARDPISLRTTQIYKLHNQTIYPLAELPRLV